MGLAGRLKGILVAAIVAVSLLAAPAGLAAVAPAVSTGAPQSVTTTSATLTGNVNPEGQSTTYHFEYGLTTAYGTTTPSTDAGSGTTSVPVTAPIASLTPNTTYHYRVVATNASGTNVGTDMTLTTAKPAAASAPGVSTGGVTSLTPTSTTLTGTVNPQGQATTYHFEYGANTHYGSVTPSASAGSGTSNVAVQATIGSLTPNKTYHYRLVATNASGTNTGADRTFKTPKPAAITIAPSPSTITFGQATTVKGTAPASTTVTLQRAVSSSGPFVNVASTTSDKNGRYSFAQRPVSNTFYRARAGAMTSSSARVLVRFRISLFVGDTTPRSGQLVRFSGRVLPRHDGLVVRIQRLTRSGFWRTVKRTFLHPAGGTASAYSTRFRVRRGGLYRATVGPDATHARGFSRDIRITVH
jgi:hypothetical protein